jgi:hypothetical protein
MIYCLSVFPSFLGSTAQLRPWPPPKNPPEFSWRLLNNFLFYRVGLLALRPTPIPEDQASVFISPRDRVAQLYSWAPSLVASYDTHGLRWDYSYSPVTTRGDILFISNQITNMATAQNFEIVFGK